MDFLTQIKTTQEMDMLVSQIDELKNNLFVPNVHPEVPSVLKADFDMAPDKEVYLAAVRDKLLAARVMDLTVPIDLPEESVARLAAWVKENVGQDVLLGFKVDSGIVAGATITFLGKFKNYSYKEELAQAVENIKM